MTSKHLGTITGPLLLFGGPYSNFQATQALFNKASQLGIAARNIICTGDVVAYCAQPNETVALLREWGAHVVMGNCEESIGSGADNCGCGFEPGSVCETLAIDWYGYTNSRIDRSHRDWMQALPRQLQFSYADKTFAVVHGSANRINQFMFASCDKDVLRNEIARTGCDGIVGGHCGIPFTRTVGDKVWHNPGVIGMPANDGSQRVWYSVWREHNGSIRIEHCALSYDAKEAHNAMRDVKLANGYAHGLLSGLWPSMDVLPETEHSQKGIALRESTHVV